MRAALIVSGQSFGRWRILRESPSRKKHRVFECECECGKIAEIHLSALRSGLSQSCGCLRKEIVTTHGMSWARHQTPTYRTWVHMRARCRSSEQPNYGGRGIRVCDRWDKFETFLADMGEKPAGTSIDRIDNDRGYEPGNCRWATMRQQLRNTRRNVWVWYGGHRVLLADAAREAGFNYATALSRKRRGWPDARLFDHVDPAYSNRPRPRGK